jgi:NAD(P)-dependent dehydrogenase (short-subunit alcohol dehydrogenase family)
VAGLLNRGVRKIYAAARDTIQLPCFGDDRVTPIALDITNDAQVQEAAQGAADTEILINNAGTAAYVSVLDGDMALIRRDMETNYFGTLNMMRAFIPILKRNKNPTIVNMNSFGAFVSFPDLGGYCASKAALFSVTQRARIELAGRGFSIHSVHPGPIDTEMIKQAQIPKTSPEEAVERMLQDLEGSRRDIFPDPESYALSKILDVGYSNLERAITQ